MNETLLDKVFSVAGGIWTLVLVAVASVVAAWLRSRAGVLERVNERKRDAADEKASDWVRLRDEVTRLSARVEALERKIDECERDRDEWHNRALAAEAEVIRLEAYHQGSGEARQAAQNILSVERKEDRDKSGGTE